MASGYMAKTLADIAKAHEPDEVLLGELWDHKNFCETHEVQMTNDEWLRWIDWYTQHHGLEDPHDAVAEWEAEGRPGRRVHHFGDPPAKD